VSVGLSSDLVTCPINILLDLKPVGVVCLTLTRATLNRTTSPPSAATHPVSVPPSSHEIVRSQVEAVRGARVDANWARARPRHPFSRRNTILRGRARYSRLCRPSPSGDSPGMPRQSCRSNHGYRTDEFPANYGSNETTAVAAPARSASYGCSWRRHRKGQRYHAAAARASAVRDGCG